MIKLETRTIVHCKCERCGYDWDSYRRDSTTHQLISERPDRCARCKYLSWDAVSWKQGGPRTNHYTVVSPDSPLANGKVPQLRPKELLEALTSAREILEQLIADLGPCDHAQQICVCQENKVLVKVTRQIEALTPFTGRKEKNAAAK